MRHYTVLLSTAILFIVALLIPVLGETGLVIKLPKVTYNEKAKIRTIKSRVVSTREGFVRGFSVVKTRIPYWKFIGIPYAEYDAFKVSLTDTSLIIGEKDCLTADVSTPTLKSSAGLPVLVWIHGGTLYQGTGSSSYFGAQRLVANGIVVVSINFRLGAMGFLCMGNAGVPGNAALKDIVEALRWVKRNVRSFGGDPNNVALVGLSTGAAFVDLVSMSPSAKGLFHKIVLMSGSLFNMVGVDDDQLPKIVQLARKLSLHTLDLDELAERFAATPTRKLVEAASAIINENSLKFTYTFGPCIERSLPGIEAFLEENPVEILKSGRYNDVPTLMAFVNREGSVAYALERKEELAKKYFDGIDVRFEAAMYDQVLLALRTHRSKVIFMEEVRKFYFGDKRINADVTNEFADFAGDVLFWYGLYRTVTIRLATSKQPIYAYEFAYEGYPDYTHNDLFNLTGVGHAEDLGFYFQLPLRLNENLIDDKTNLTISRVMTIIKNFLVHNNPLPSPTQLIPVKWEPLKKENNFPYLRITDTIEMRYDPYSERRMFLENLCRKLNISLYG